VPDLKPATALGAYAIVLVLVFAAALGVGRAVGPVGPAPAHSTTAPGSAGSHSDMQGEHP
jgi:hypothetical protein